MRAAAYPAFTANAFQARLAYRNQVWASCFGELVGIFARIAIWISVYAGATSQGGITLPEMITYALLAGPVLYWDYSKVLYDVGNAVKTGDVAVFLLKPLHYPAYLLASHVGNFLFELIVIIVPVSIIVGLVFGLLPPASLFHAVAFLAYWTLSFLILFSMAALLGLAAFWLMTAFSLEWFLQGIMSLFSGGLVPLWFFPAPLAAIAGYLPFAWVSYYPAAVYLGKLDVDATLIHFAIGLVWLVALVGGTLLLWNRARQRLVVQGG